MKTKFYIQYDDKYPNNTKHIIIKAKDMYDAEDKFYKNNRNCLIRKISKV